MTEGFAPLRGTRVVEMSHMIMGPACGFFLAALGADVIKVEPLDGDRTRHLTGMGRAFFPTFNRGKRSVTLALDTPEGRDALHQLLARADVLVENFRENALTRLGCDGPELRKRHPHLVAAACKGFLSGPYAHRPALDEVVQMMTGMAYMTGPAGRPLRIGSSANDIMGGLFAAFGVVASLLERQTGPEDRRVAGRDLRIGLFENSLLLVAQHMVQFDLDGVEAPPMPERAFSWPVYDIFVTAEGRQLFIGAVTDKHWAALCNLLHLDALRDHPDLQDRMARIEARGWTVPVVARAVEVRAFSALVAGLEEAGLPFAPVARPSEMYEDPQAMRPGGMQSVALPDGSVFRAPSLPIEIDGVPAASDPVGVPALGADTEDVLREIGLDTDAIAAAQGRAD